MFQLIADNFATIVISALLLAGVISIIAGMVKKKAKGQSVSCGCGCSGCPSASLCHPGQGDRDLSDQTGGQGPV